MAESCIRFLAILTLASVARAGDTPQSRTLTISEVRRLEALSDDKWGKAFALLGPVNVELEGVFRLRAQRAVVWLDPKAGASLLDLVRGAGSKERRIPLWAVRAIYAEGGRTPAVFHAGGRVFRCRSLFYNFVRHTGILVDAELRLRRKDPLVDELPDLVGRARRLIARGPGRWTARDLELFTTDYHEPEISVHVERLELKDKEVAAALGAVVRLSAKSREKGEGIPQSEVEEVLKNLGDAALDVGTLEIDLFDTSARLFGVSILSWPHIRTDQETLLRLRVEAELGSRGRLGDGAWVGVGIRNRPIGFLVGGGYFQNRGTLVDLEIMVDTADTLDNAVKGRSITSYMRDHGVGQPQRDRYWSRHQYRWTIRESLRLDGELAALSDANWLLTYDEREFKEGKALETLLHLRHRGALGYVSLVGKVRTISFLQDVEELPSLTASLPVLNVVNLGGAVLQLALNAQVANLRLRRAKGDPATDLRMARIDLDPTLFLSFNLGPVRIVPYARLRYTGYEESVTGGSLSRFAGTYGVRADLQLWRWFGERRHVVNVSVEYMDLATVSQAASSLFGIDAVDMLTPYEALIVRLRSRLQQRGDDGIATFLTFEIHGVWFPDGQQPLGAMGDGFIDLSLAWWRDEEMGFGARADIDPELGELSAGAIEAWWQASRRLLVALGLRHLQGDSDVLTLSAETSIDTRWRFVLFSQTDLKNGEALDQGLLITRMGKTASLSVRLAYDPGDGNFSLSLKIDLVEAFRKREARRRGEIRLSEFSAR